MAHPLNPLEVLLEVLQAGGLQQAASRLGRTPSALSKLVKSLERQVGQPLVEHGAKPLRLTEVGRLYAEAARQMREQLRNAEDQSALLRKQVGGNLRVTASYLLGHAVLAEYVVAFRRRYPQVQLELVLSDEDLDPVTEQFDLAIRHEPGSGADLVGRALGTNRVRVCGTPDYFERHGQPRTPQDLAQHACLVFRCEPLDARWHFHRDGQHVCVVPRGALSANSDELLLASLRAGEGLLPCFDWVVGRELAEGRLQSCLDDWRFESEAFGAPELWVAYPKGKRGRPKINLFIDGLIEHLAELSSGRRPGALEA
jgi:DNA-binding transcriptional LysR family regulator